VVADLRPRRRGDRHGECKAFGMTDGANTKFASRLMAVVFMGLAFAGCAMILSSGERSLFAEAGTYEGR